MDSAILKKRLARIAGLHGGRLTPDAVVEDAKSPKSPLHEHFDWDDSVAAVKWRIEQARTLIRQVTVTVTSGTRTVCVPFYIRDPSAGAEQGYVATAQLRTSEGMARDALRAEMIAANAICERALGLAEYFGLAAEIGHIKDRIAVIQQHLAA